MNKESLKVVNDINRAIIKARGIYSEWSARHGISYHEMLVLYTIREFGFCTQKQICDSYLLPTPDNEQCHYQNAKGRSAGIQQCALYWA